MPELSIVGPNPLPAAKMTTEERIQELATILAAGIARARHPAARQGGCQKRSRGGREHLWRVWSASRLCRSDA
jgi:hypothetical protein